MVAAKHDSLEYVVLLHGIGHAAASMLLLERTFKNQGYVVLNLSYPSRKNSIADLTHWLYVRLEKENIWPTASKVHFVAHSMGGLVSGFYLQKYMDKFPRYKVGRVVMLGTPHGGSEVADFLHQNSLYRSFFGPAGQELTTAVRSQNKIDPWYESGVIAGTQNWLYPLGYVCFEDAHDGCVSVASTKVQGMADHVVLPVMHGVMGWSPSVRKQCVHFVRHGKFM